ncbi:MAG: hypothetical protein K2X48_14605 [Chitinophagaceae bacterium]|nr:hypothetical protein [Chitinophagaceae bacterium]
MKKTILTVALFISIKSFAQTYLEPFAGISYDLRNKQHFTLVNTGMAISFKTNSFYEFSAGVIKKWGTNKKSTDSAFTTNISLPVSAIAEKIYQPSAFDLFINNRFTILKSNNINSLNLILLFGISIQRVKVSYNYNKNDYTVLNPEISIAGTGFFAGTGIEYMKQIKKGRLIAQLSVATLPVTKKQPAINSFRLLAPLSLNIGYSIPLSKK